jgi:hypothetical protein
VGCDGNRVFHNDRACPGVRVPSRFDRIDEELRVYRDGEAVYDRFMRVMEVDVETFEPVPMNTAHREKLMNTANEHYARQGTPLMPPECAMRYWIYAIDRQTLYSRNPTVDLYAPCVPGEAADLLRRNADDGCDLREFLASHERARDYPWVAALRSERLL